MTDGALTRSRIERYFYECRRDGAEPELNGALKAAYLPAWADAVWSDSPFFALAAAMPPPSPIVYDVPRLALAGAA